MDLGIFYLDWSSLLGFFNQSGWSIFLIVLSLGGWLILAKYIFFALLHLYEDLRQHQNVHHWKYVLLAVDIPALNVQTPKAVEQMFSHLAGAYSHPDLKEKLKDGYKQRWFSLEIISLAGYIQFLIWTEEAFRDLVEASIYAQYPDADVIEVEDYVDAVPDVYPNATHDVWISDFGLAEHSAYPIRSYREFEHAISKDTVLKDPMGTFLESFSRLGPGEQMYFQILVEPVGNDWKENAIAKIKELIGEKPDPHGGHGGHGGGGSAVFDHISNAPGKFLEALGDEVFNREAGEHGGGHEEKSGPPNQLQYLTPGMGKLIEAMELKIGKLAFKTKIRALYSAPKQVFNPRRGITAMLGALKQYNIPSANSIVPTLGGLNNTRKHLKRKKLLVKAYKKRKINAGGPTCILNIEELATIWHFPMSHVKTPLVQKAATKQAEPPVGLPVELVAPPVLREVGSLDENGVEITNDMPHMAPTHFTTDSGDKVGYGDGV